MPNFLDILGKLFQKKPAFIPAEQVKQGLSDKDKEMLRKIGVVSRELNKVMEKLTQINLERMNIYKECDRAIQHWLVGSALEVYADTATTYDQLHNASVWITSENQKYLNELNKLLDRIDVEEKIFDWAYTLATYGDLFIKVIAEPGLGIITIDDSEHPINISRADYHGRLIGFYKTPLGYGSTTIEKLLPPWEYVHFKLLGVKRKRPYYGDPMWSEFRSVNILSPDVKRIESTYGTPIIINALPVWKRLRLAEDALLMARISRGILRYIYKVKVSGENIEAVSEIIDEYDEILKKARALDIDPNNPEFLSKFSPLSSIEDIVIPVWGDTNDLSIEKIGGEADIKWITDIEELRNQLSAALRVPLQVLGGYGAEIKSGLGESALERLDIRFARTCRRLQRALIDGIMRLCQIHLAYMNMAPDLNLFRVNMATTSSAEEEELKNALDKGVDVVDKLVDLIFKHIGEEGLDKEELLNYFNHKILKLGDFDIKRFKKAVEQKALQIEGIDKKDIERINYVINEAFNRTEPQRVSSDLKTFLPTGKDQEVWESVYGKVKLKVEVVKA